MLLKTVVIFFVVHFVSAVLGLAIRGIPTTESFSDTFAIDYFDDTGTFSAQGQANKGDKAGRVHVIIGPKPSPAGQ